MPAHKAGNVGSHLQPHTYHPKRRRRLAGRKAFVAMSAKQIGFNRKKCAPLPWCSKDGLDTKCARQVRLLFLWKLVLQSTNSWGAHHRRGYTLHSTWLGVVSAMPKLCSHAPCVRNLYCSSLRLLTPGTKHKLQISTSKYWSAAPQVCRASARGKVDANDAHLATAHIAPQPGLSHLR